eukprot:m.75965 g.75965  ORF g.75965 m.75965 type:complete len:253 (-) comp12470_c0_seq1:410-1168(-)
MEAPQPSFVLRGVCQPASSHMQQKGTEQDTSETVGQYTQYGAEHSIAKRPIKAWKGRIDACRETFETAPHRSSNFRVHTKRAMVVRRACDEVNQVFLADTCQQPGRTRRTVSAAKIQESRLIQSLFPGALESMKPWGGPQIDEEQHQSQESVVAVRLEAQLKAIVKSRGCIKLTSLAQLLQDNAEEFRVSIVRFPRTTPKGWFSWAPVCNVHVRGGRVKYCVFLGERLGTKKKISTCSVSCVKQLSVVNQRG